MTADEIREQVAAALRRSAHVCGGDGPCPCYDWSDEEYDAAVHATAVNAGHVDEVQGIPEAFAAALLPTVQALIAKGAAAELRKAADEYETDGEIVSALADQARVKFDLASEAAYAITASDFRHIAGRLRKRAEARDGTP